MTAATLIAAALGYLVGSVPVAWLIVRWVTGQDLRRRGSGNVGATNALRSTGWRAGALVAILDIAKGALAAAMGGAVTGSQAGSAAAGVAALVGHAYPVWLGFHGGKGVAPAAGVFALLTPLPAGVSVLAFFVVALTTRLVSLASLAGALILVATVVGLGASNEAAAAAAAASGLIVWRHRDNIGRLAAGTEPRLGGDARGRFGSGAARERGHDGRE